MNIRHQNDRKHCDKTGFTDRRQALQTRTRLYRLGPGTRGFSHKSVRWSFWIRPVQYQNAQPMPEWSNWFGESLGQTYSWTHSVRMKRRRKWECSSLCKARKEGGLGGRTVAGRIYLGRWTMKSRDRRPGDLSGAKWGRWRTRSLM